MICYIETNVVRMKKQEDIQPTTDKAHPDEAYLQWASMVRRRKATPAPDVEQCWADFARKHRPRPARVYPRWWLGAAACLGAGLMFLALKLLDGRARHGEWEQQTVVAMRHDDRPQQVLWRTENRYYDLSSQDSLSLLPPGGSVSASAPVTMGDSRAHTAHRSQRLTTPRGMDFRIILPDSSEVWLNAESSIEFPETFSGPIRQVVLQGEAFFKVARNEQKPFVVTSPQLQVKVLGTSFNFKSYASQQARVSLVEGAVEVMQADGKPTQMTLRPGESACVDEQGSLRRERVDTYGVTQWTKGYFYFDNVPLVDILQELGRWYNLGVVFKNAEQMDYSLHFSASRHEGIEQAVDHLNRLRKVRVVIEGHNLVVY